MRVTLNGKPKELEEAITILTLLQQLGLHPQQVAVEINRDIIKRESYESHVLHEGDEIEVLRFVGGGSNSMRSVLRFPARYGLSNRIKLSLMNFPSPFPSGRGSG